VNPPAESKRSVNARITSGPLGSDCCADGAAIISNPATTKVARERFAWAQSRIRRIIAQ